MQKSGGARATAIVYSVLASLIALICGSLVGWYARTFLLGFWNDVRSSGAIWLYGHGYSIIGRSWSIVAGLIPGWTLAVALGTAVGVLAPRRWLWLGLLVAVGLVATPEIVMLWFGGHPFQIYLLTTAAHILALNVSEMPVLLLTAWGASRLRPQRHPQGCCQTCGYDLTGTSAVCVRSAGESGTSRKRRPKPAESSR